MAVAGALVRVDTSSSLLKCSTTAERVGDIVFMEGLCTKLFMTLFPIKNQNHPAPFHGVVTVSSGLQLGTVKDGGSVGK